jgi:hypothetical protein
MAINNFTKVEIDGNGALKIQGETIDPKTGLKLTGGIDPNTEIRVAVISSEPAEGKRCDPNVHADASGSWLGLAPAGTHDFHDHDIVYVVGHLTVPPSDEIDLWCAQMRIGDPKPLAESDTNPFG